MPLDPQCIFCRIVSGQAVAHKVYRDPLVTAFMDIHPVTKGHLLVVPNSHFPTLASLDPQYAAQMMAAARRLSGALRAAPLSVEGVNLHLADGVAAGQSVFHCHLHVIPRYAGDKFGFQRPIGAPDGDPMEIEQIASMLRPAVADGVA
jgi:diadenosine tetraphosphate (Ap4A) HIT family hydrolase